MNEDIQKLGRRIKQLRIAKGYPTAEAFATQHDIEHYKPATRQG